MAVLLALLFPVAASASTDGVPAPAGEGQVGAVTSAAVTPAAVGPGGGMPIPAAPRIGDVICLTGCTAIRSGSVGGTVEISGSALEAVEAVTFRSKQARIRVRPDSVERSRVTATVPEGAIRGALKVIAIGGSVSNASPVLTIGAAPKTRGKIRVVDAASTPVKTYQFGARRPTLRFIVAGSSPTADLRIDVLDRRGTAVQSIFRKRVPTGAPQRVAWSGKVRSGKRARDGAYRFEIRTAEGSNALLSRRLARQQSRAKTSARRRDPFGFRIYGFIFPLKGAHSYGNGIGAARSGHTHQGVDILARCGLPIRAARAGTVYWNAYDAGGAGNYLVINTRGNGGKSQVYMHMPRRSKFRKGARIKTGQVIGHVGSTGASSACHLHFEQWSAPGWYQGGTFMNPMPLLKRWDRYS